jgi:hypothetical protein
VFTSFNIAPVVDLPYLASAETRVEENKGETDFDVQLRIPIGTNMGMTVDDFDGSQYLSAVISGFPTNAIDLFYTEGFASVAALVDKKFGTVTVSGNNSTEVLQVLESLVVVLAHDDDRNFLLTLDGICKDSNGAVEVQEDYSLTHTVIVSAVADTPLLRVGDATKPLALEGAVGKSYPVTIALNDRDGK